MKPRSNWTPACAGVANSGLVRASLGTKGEKRRLRDAGALPASNGQPGRAAPAPAPRMVACEWPATHSPAGAATPFRWKGVNATMDLLSAQGSAGHVRDSEG